MFHGNAGNHGHRIPLAQVFYMRMRCNVLMMCYRGWATTVVDILNFDQGAYRYGRSDGTPSEQGKFLLFWFRMQVMTITLIGIQMDAQTGLDYLLQHSSYKQTPIVRSFFDPCSIAHIYPRSCMANPLVEPFQLTWSARTRTRWGRLLYTRTNNGLTYNQDCSAHPREYLYVPPESYSTCPSSS